jgi:hypothetical protein
MTTEDRPAGTQGDGRAGARGDPLGMSEAEKRMAEWEARHDVAARGHRAAPDVLQHYLAHERLVHDRLAGERPSPALRPARTVAGREAESLSRTPDAAVPAEERPRGLLRRLFRRSG